MQPLICFTVGYITGILWGLYIDINIVPIIFLCFWGLVFIAKKIKSLEKYKLYILLFIISIIFSNIQIGYLENKFNTLYLGIENIDIKGTIISDAKYTKYRTSYIIKVQSINGNTKYKNTCLNLYLKDNQNLKYGEKISFSRNV